MTDSKPLAPLLSSHQSSTFRANSSRPRWRESSREPANRCGPGDLSIFLSHRIPAVTLGVTHGFNYYEEDATMEIEPMFRGIAQIVGVLMAIDSGVCDE